MQCLKTKETPRVGSKRLATQKEIRRLIVLVTIVGVLFEGITGYFAHSVERYALALLFGVCGLIAFLGSTTLIEETGKEIKE
ncbi:MAG: hypothetical protein A3A28_01810 [Candidatus Sungbacteria bacterium RIFCSPLOWO2_01_FULL_47_32]|uniref:Uncharacterized protein n=1 Tax=Candidatus Sungbacteria bacterium RIFCSPHIGHO2_01_FULL_47_32 TaxID=1802264 RepID=A0A1G2K674_9BACT|nr:MAG: hypothetical protein A2633_03795 [Candidatus Sungbacteria bacterium RIFCSPHIGHO2_01_FULL_47_32]OHA05302.1 MAG: hypothetical protein A3A28_01810 [Candidatus Sungbacteria bacterium RIFCSPLOWO2_01_FULL_47_32]